ncbi:MAG TPA: T9SS type A sorting domain-containing protein, partial [Candidatus Cloacimonadota bacterium]|nr:T9SS type A sorting domain-containing protein [Candidatus Cloacimonadota bacterium]
NRWQPLTLDVFIDQSGNESLPLVGSYSYTKPLSRLKIIPNPVKNPMEARLLWYHDDLQGKPIYLSLYNLRGQLIREEYLGTVHVGEGKSYLMNLIPEFASLSKGVYLLKLKIGKEYYTAKFTILY